MLSKLFLRIINSEGISRFLDLKAKVIQKTDPSRIYVENIRSFFGLPNRIAKFLCNIAVYEGFFNHKTGFLCKNCSSIIASIKDKELPELEYECTKCEFEEADRYRFKWNELSTIDFYELVERNAK